MNTGIGVYRYLKKKGIELQFEACEYAEKSSNEQTTKYITQYAESLINMTRWHIYAV